MKHPCKYIHDFLVSVLRVLCLSLVLSVDVADRTTASKMSSTPSVSDPCPLTCFDLARLPSPETVGLPLSVETQAMNLLRLQIVENDLLCSTPTIHPMHIVSCHK